MKKEICLLALFAVALAACAVSAQEAKVAQSGLQGPSGTSPSAVSTAVSSSALMPKVEAYLRSNTISYRSLPGKSAIIFEIGAGDSSWHCVCDVREKEKQFIFYSLWPLKVPTEKRVAVAEYITRANFNMLVGNFEMDFEDGELRYKTIVDLADGELTVGMVRRAVGIALGMSERYLPGLTKVVFGGISPRQAIRTVEAD